ncbi:MAG: hemerythrin domain-containing protein [Humibacillus sp.]|nr:hemerythrin domain-containing protein [Humibacillus sp.]MDN5780210.1 hemerythrin domain-containing protein [Humibacillus sp.]
MCNYCGCRDITVVGRFMTEHEHIINHLGVLRDSLHDAERRRAATVTLGEHLLPHTGSEEVGLFTVLARDEVFTEHISRLCGEHQLIESLLGQISAGELDVFPELETVLRDHMDREDNGLFPAAAIHLGGPEWDEVDDLTPAALSTQGEAH